MNLFGKSKKPRKVARKSSKKPVKLKSTYKKGYLMTVSNPKGTRKPAYVAETLKGTTARYVGSHKNIGTIKGSAGSSERYARKLARKGHKKVSIWD